MYNRFLTVDGLSRLTLLGFRHTAPRPPFSLSPKKTDTTKNKNQKQRKKKSNKRREEKKRGEKEVRYLNQ